MTTEKTNLQWKAPTYAKNNTIFQKITQPARKISSAYMHKKRKNGLCYYYKSFAIGNSLR